MICLHCNLFTNNPKFCSNSCAASYNNKGVRRRGKEPNICICGKVATSRTLFCSIECSGLNRRKDKKEINLNNQLRQQRYRAKKLRCIDSTANLQQIKAIYKNCPDGHEVDHIIPLSKGGKHHENNLQYLTIEENRRKGNKVVGETGFEPISKPL